MNDSDILIDPDGMSVSQVAKAMGISERRVQQIERAALAKLRKDFKAKGIKAEDLMDVRRIVSEVQKTGYRIRRIV